MFDPDLLEELPVDKRELVHQGILLLVSTGVLQLQKQRLFARIAEGADDEDKEKLSERILEYRRESHGIESLIQLGEELKRKLERETEE